jgi:hypothetical protein
MDYLKDAAFILLVVAVASRVPMLDKLVFNTGA